YDFVAGNQYRITVTELVPCEGQAPQGFPTLNFNTNCTTPTAVGSWQSLPAREVQSLCSNLETTCDQSPDPVGTNWTAYTYTRLYTFDLSCADYTIGVRRTGRPTDLTNGTQGQPIYAYCSFKPGVALHAPGFLFEPGVHIDDSTEAHLSLGFVDVDRDSLIATLMDPLDSAGVTIPLNSGFAAQSPLGAGWATTWDAETGNIGLTPVNNTIQKSAVAVAVSEYTNKIEVGTIFFEMPLITIDRVTPLNKLPYLITPQALDSIRGGSWLDSFVIKTMLNQELSVKFKAVDIEGDSTRMTHITNLPDAVFYNELDDPVSRRDTVVGIDPIAVLEWTARQAGSYGLGLQLAERPETCGPLGSRNYQCIVQVQDTCIWVDLGADTLYACVADSIEIAPIVSGNYSSPLTFLWNNTGQDSTNELTVPGYHWVEVRDTTQGCNMRDSVFVVWTDECVWPGDADFDGISNHYDILPIGLAYGFTGPVRPKQGRDWDGTGAFAWGDTTLNGIDRAHADTDGNGIINADDTLAISENYNFRHSKTGGESEDGNYLYFLAPTDPVNTGDTLIIPIILGADTALIDSVYGIAFSVSYTQSLVDSGKVSYSLPDSSFLGKKTNLISIQHDDFNVSLADLGISRIDQTNRASYGQIASVGIVVIIDVIGKKEIDTLDLTFEDIRLVTANGTILDAVGFPAKIIVEGEEDSSTSIPPAFATTQVYPNPARELLVIQDEVNESMDISLVDMHGKTLAQRIDQRGTTTLSLSDFAPGVYCLKLKRGATTWTSRIVHIP
ncbi:MAG: T9SS type A sorting domain-containing protein, partial [Bacteroidia bacterium]